MSDNFLEASIVMKKVIALCSALCAFSVTAESQNTTKEWTVDYSGKPPYKRTLTEINVVDVAKLETAETQVISTTDFSGKPPFKRNVETLQVVDAAVLEATDDSGKKTRKGRPPFKRH